MKPKILPLLEHCIETGVLFGYRRPFKHDDNPSEEYIVSCIQEEIMNQVYEHFEFDES